MRDEILLFLVNFLCVQNTHLQIKYKTNVFKVPVEEEIRKFVFVVVVVKLPLHDFNYIYTVCD